MWEKGKTSKVSLYPFIFSLNSNSQLKWRNKQHFVSCTNTPCQSEQKNDAFLNKNTNLYCIHSYSLFTACCLFAVQFFEYKIKIKLQYAVLTINEINFSLNKYYSIWLYINSVHVITDHICASVVALSIPPMPSHRPYAHHGKWRNEMKWILSFSALHLLLHEIWIQNVAWQRKPNKRFVSHSILNECVKTDCDRRLQNCKLGKSVGDYSHSYRKLNRNN